MNSLPIYNLIETTIKTDLSSAEKNKLISDLSLLDPQTHITVFAIIRRYHLLHLEGNGNLFEVPYQATFLHNTKNVQFNLENLPYSLKHMLVKFMQIHFKTIETQ